MSMWPSVISTRVRPVWVVPLWPPRRTDRSSPEVCAGTPGTSSTSSRRISRCTSGPRRLVDDGPAVAARLDGGVRRVEVGAAHVLPPRDEQLVGREARDHLRTGRRDDDLLLDPGRVAPVRGGAVRLE